MKTFRASISTLGILVLTIAFDCAVLRFAFGSNDRTWLDLFALPMLNVLVLTFAHRRDRRRGGNRTPFLDGFLWLGWAALGLYLIWCRIHPEETIWALAVASESVHWLTLDTLDFDTMRRVDPTFRLAWKISKAAQAGVASGIVTAVMLLVAACGGIMNRRRHRIRSRAAIPV